MPYSTYLKEDPIDSKRSVGLFQISQKKILFSPLITAKWLWGNLMMHPLFSTLQKQDLLLPFSLVKKRIYLDTHLKEKFKRNLLCLHLGESGDPSKCKLMRTWGGVVTSI